MLADAVRRRGPRAAEPPRTCTARSPGPGPSRCRCLRYRRARAPSRARAPPRTIPSPSGRRGGPTSRTSRPRRRRLLGDPPAAPPPEAAPGAQPEVNVELIQDLIKKLADELNGGPPARDGEAQPEAAPASTSAAEAMVGRSVAALETTARSMRSATADAPQSAGARLAGGLGAPAVRGPTRARRPGPPAAAARSQARAHRRGDRGGAHRGAAGADPRSLRRPAAPLRGQHAPADGRRRRARAERLLARCAWAPA